MVVPRRVENILDLISLSIRPLLVHRPRVIVHSPVDCQQREHDNRLFVDDVELVADGCDGETRAAGEDRRLGGDAVARERVEDVGGGVFRLSLWWLGVLGACYGGGEGGYRRSDGADREGWASAGGACGELAGRSMGLQLISW